MLSDKFYLEIILGPDVLPSLPNNVLVHQLGDLAVVGVRQQPRKPIIMRRYEQMARPDRQGNIALPITQAGGHDQTPIRRQQ